jgi:excisionase family DNA binding protein
MAPMMVSAGEAARRLGVAPATVQRWVDSGVLHAERTPGGHRRIYVTELRRLIAANRPADGSGPLAAWLDALMSGDWSAVKAALLASRQRAESWADTADEVASAIAEIGRRWEAGCCEVFEEHAASEALRRAAAACAGEMRRDSNAPIAVLFTVENERHTLGLSLAELVLAEAGWHTRWIGEGPPAEELASLVTKFKPSLLVVSASSLTKPATMGRYQEALTRSCNAGTQLALAGSGAWGETQDAWRVETFRDLQGLLAGQFAKRPM